MLTHQWVLGPPPQFLRQFKPPIEAKVSFGGRRGRTDGNAEVDDSIRIGEEDVANAAAGAPEFFCNVCEFAVLPLGHQFGDISRKEQSQIPGVAGVVHDGIALDAAEGQKGDAGHHQAHHQGGDGQKLGLQAEFCPPSGDPLPETLGIRIRPAGFRQGPVSGRGSCHPLERT